MANNVKDIRISLGMSRKEFGEALNLTQMCIGNYENNQRDPSITIAYKIIDLAKKNKIEISLEDLFPRDPNIH
jgi:DNA-binding XRE family transcriptional regulator